ncbi:hypothetical protein HZ326_13116 [Fusarium oxysporum f. sp. albedinis]|jgi:hypothetical protein|nr:hypothetical protein HZ326_13116 [Fusarium oxysporum f. sp. albedinis]
MSDGGSELPLHSPKTLGQENEDGGILGDSWQRSWQGQEVLTSDGYMVGHTGVVMVESSSWHELHLV